METQENTLLFTLDQLEELRIPYYVTGSVAVSIYGKPRFTHDVDFVVSILPSHISQLVERFKSQFYVSEVGLRDAFEHHSMANLIHQGSGFKVDLWMLDPKNSYARSQFERRQEKAAFGRRVFFISPEDIVLQKLLWFKETSADRDWNDVIGVWEFLSDSLDRRYIEQWSGQLSVTNLWRRVLSSTL